MWGRSVASATRQYYAATARVRCICVIISSREIDERGGREWGRERRPGDEVRDAVSVVQWLSIFVAAAIFSLLGRAPRLSF
jgi:hypothetical protein